MAAASRNLEKHTNRNPVHQFLLGRFHRRVAALVTLAKGRLPAAAGTPDPLLLDAGCGEGFVARRLGAEISGLQIVGLDANRDSLTYARRLSPDRGSWLAADAARLPFRDRSIPIVLCIEVLEHVPEPWPALDELARVCSGYLVLSVPNQPFFALANLLRGKNLSTLGDDPEHVSHWRAATFLRELGKRVRVEAAAYSFPWVLALAAPRCEAGRNA